MRKINFCKKGLLWDQKTISGLTRGVLVLICITIVETISAQENLPVIGVLGLTNNGGISTLTVDSICNKISDLVEQTQRFYVLKREFISPVLQEQGMTINNLLCSQKEGLAAAGNLLSADQMIGGTILRKEGKLSINLLRINVLNRIQLSSQRIEASNILALENGLQKIIESLLNDSSSIMIQKPLVLSPNTNVENKNELKEPSVIQEKRKKKGPILILLSAILIAGGAAGAYVYHESMGPDQNIPDVPLSDLPSRIR